jgi:hypothetical protein
MSRRELGIAAPVVAVSLFFISSMPAYAYLDPGTGSMMLQIILGGIAGLLVAGKLFWGRIVDFFGSIFRRDSAPESVTSRESEVKEQEREPAGRDK